MDPQIAQYWEDAITPLKTAERYFAEGKIELAKNKAKDAAMLGLPVIMILLNKSINERCIASDTFSDFIKDIETKHYSPKETIEKARGLLNSFSNLLPPESKLPII